MSSQIKQSERISAINKSLGDRSVVLVGMMGCGKSAVGRRLAQILERKFYDSDSEIVRAAGMEISEIFAKMGEAEFRAGEKRVILRLIAESRLVLATGGGAYMDEEIRNELRKTAVSIWLDASFEVLFERISRKKNRPLMETANPAETLKELLKARTPIYAQADITVVSRDRPISQMIEEVLTQLEHFLYARNSL